MRTNTARPPAPKTFEGTTAKKLHPYDALRRAVAGCLLWEDSFYEDGEAIAVRIAQLVAQVPADKVVALAIEARNNMNLRHVPLLLARELVKNKNGANIASLLPQIINRPDELCEFLALYWEDGKVPIASSVKRGLAVAFTKFSPYQLQKYNNQDRAIKLRDVLFLVHAKPNDPAQAETWKQLVEGKLPEPGTWENRLSASKGVGKKEIWTGLLKDRELKALALLRNLRNMLEVGVDVELLRAALNECNVDKVLPFRFITAARYAPSLESDLEKLMFRCLEGVPKLTGRTALVVDTSPSMWGMKVSEKSELDRFEAAAALAMLCREICDEVRVYYFNADAGELPARRGFALRDVLARTQGGSSYGNKAVKLAGQNGYDRIVVFTDGEWHASSDSDSGVASKVILPPKTNKAYLINVASYQNAVGSGKWDMIDGWSESIIQYIQAIESLKENE